MVKMDHRNWEENLPCGFIDFNQAERNHPQLVTRHKEINQEYGNNDHISQTFPEDQYSYVPNCQCELQSFDHGRILKKRVSAREPCYPYDRRRILSSRYFFPHKNKYEIDYHSNKQNLRRRNPDFHGNHRDFYGNHFCMEDTSDRKSCFPITQNCTHTNLPPALWESDNKLQMMDTQSFNQENEQQIYNMTHVTDYEEITFGTAKNADVPSFAPDMEKPCASEEPTTFITLSSVQPYDTSNSPISMVEFPSKTNENISAKSITEEPPTFITSSTMQFNDISNSSLTTVEFPSATKENSSIKSTTGKKVSMKRENSLTFMNETEKAVYYLLKLYPSSGVENSIPDLSSKLQLVPTNKICENLIQEVFEDKKFYKIINCNSQIQNQCNDFPNGSETKLVESSETSTEEIKIIESNSNETDKEICRSSSEIANKNSDLANSKVNKSCNKIEKNSDHIIFNSEGCFKDLEKNNLTEVKDVHFNTLEAVSTEQSTSLEISSDYPLPGSFVKDNFQKERICNENMPISFQMARNSVSYSENPPNKVETSVIDTGNLIEEYERTEQVQCDESIASIDFPVRLVDSDFESDGFKVQLEKVKSKCEKETNSNVVSSASEATYSYVLSQEEQHNPVENCINSLTNDESTDTKNHNDKLQLKTFKLPEESASIL